MQTGLVVPIAREEVVANIGRHLVGPALLVDDAGSRRQIAQRERDPFVQVGVPHVRLPVSHVPRRRRSNSLIHNLLLSPGARPPS